MKNHRIFLACVTLVLGLAMPAFADWDDPHPWRHRGYGWHHMMEGSELDCSGYGGQANLSDEQTEKIEQERRAFWEENRELRAQIYQKELELRAEIAKLQPDPTRTAELQRELSNLESQLDQKRIEHILRMKAINPYIGVGHVGPCPRTKAPYGPGGGHRMMEHGAMGHGSMGCGMMGSGMGKRDRDRACCGQARGKSRGMPPTAYDDSGESGSEH